ncbi:MAG: helix-turn-helix transcriptional regulator [Dehalococcoidia bacterium]
MKWKEHKQQLMKDAAFKSEYDKLATEYKVASELIRLRLSRGMTQEELARAVNTQQASIARMESGSYLPSLSMIKKIADALDADLEIKLKHRGQSSHALTIADRKRGS